MIVLHNIEINNLTFKYENRTDFALENVTLNIAENEFVLLAGASGSGKSTLLKCLNGLIPHRYLGDYSGEVKVSSRLVPNTKFLDMASSIGTVLQEADKQLVSSIVEDDVAFGPGNMALPRPEIERRVTNSLQSMEISNLRDRSIFAISGGQKQRLAIADIIAMEPEVLLFDEPLANLDSNGVRLMQDIFRELHKTGKTIVVAEHRTEEVLKADPTRIAVIDNGKLLADSNDPKILMNYSDVLKVPAEYVVEKYKHGPGEKGNQLLTHVSASTKGPELIRVENVTFEYSGGIRALDNINITVNEGERIALLGNNGAGKSTLALSMVGLLKPTSGKVLVRGVETLRRITIRNSENCLPGLSESFLNAFWQDCTGGTSIRP